MKKLTWKQVRCADCKSCQVTWNGKPEAPNELVCGNCLSGRLTRKYDQTEETISNIYRIANQFLLDKSKHVLKDDDGDHLAWLEELVKIGDDAIAAIKKELNERKTK